MTWYEYIDGKRTGAFGGEFGDTPTSLHAAIAKNFQYPFEFTVVSATECVITFSATNGKGHAMVFKLEPLPRFGLKRIDG